MPQFASTTTLGGHQPATLRQITGWPEWRRRVGRLPQSPWTRGNGLLGYDPDLRRLWIAGQRLHHGATGMALGWATAAGLLGRRCGATRAALMLASGVLIAHDWKDRSIWFSSGAARLNRNSASQRR